MNGEQVWGLVRTVLAAVGGWVVAKGYADDALVQAILGGVGTIFVGAWSYASKRKPVA